MKNAQASYSEADRRFEKAQNTLENVLSGGTPVAAIEGEQLALGIASAATRGNGK